MSLIDFSCLFIIIVFAQLIESSVLIRRDYDDGPIVVRYVGRSSAEEVEHKHQATSTNYKPKRTHSKKTVLQYGRHIYHLDNFADLKNLRADMTQFKPDYVSYDYVDIGDLFRSSDSAKQGVADYLKDIFVFSNTPLQFCDGDQCEEDLRKFSKHKHDDDTDGKRKKMQFGRTKRYQIVANRHKSKKPKSDSSEEYHEKKKQKTSKKKKRKNSSKTADRKSKESGSAEKTRGSHKIKKKKHEPPLTFKESVDVKRKPKKKHNYDNFPDTSVKKQKNHDKDLKSNEEFRKKKKRKHNYGSSDETIRKTFEDYLYKQGNKIFHAEEGKRKKKHYDFDKRRRLDNFLPKRYHWDASDIHDLGYYWFNGPKGKYAAPAQLNMKK